VLPIFYVQLGELFFIGVPILYQDLGLTY